MKYTSEDLYKGYLAQRKKTSDYLSKRNIQVDRPALNKYQFNITLEAFKQGYKDRGVNPPSNLKLAQQIARGDYYSYSTSQAKAIKKAYESIGEKAPSLNVIKTVGMTGNLTQAIKEFRKQSKSQGLTNYQTAIAVSQFFFGSE